MDLIAYKNKENNDLKKYIQKYYGEIPRNRGIRFMKLESKVDDKPSLDVTDLFPIEEVIDYSSETKLFNKYVGQDVIYIHTRCGDCGLGYDDEDSNYVYCGAKDWEEEHKELFLEHITNSFDSTYCTHYFKAVIDNDYEKIIKQIGEVNENS